MSVEDALKQLENISLPSERYSYLKQLKDNNLETFQNIINNGLENFPVCISDLHLSSSDLSELDKKIESSIIDSTISPQIAVITCKSELDEEYVVDLHRHVKTAGINISNILSIIMGYNEEDLDRVIKLLNKLYPGIHILLILMDSLVLFFSSNATVFEPVLEFFEEATLSIWLVKNDGYFNYNDLEYLEDEDGEDNGYENFGQLISYCRTKLLQRIFVKMAAVQSRGS
ncbi:hypothetical protein RclHR1_06420021 [Rhizophagus clarus]|uniref:Uncharacterized protein n=1 Tax=Rhizophagus clarus TaxID=94130 RepID=A0A2Z6RRQ2_9GLOM|nr:hypothetical protein RclHR1_06420021 [Rhizophagus clarus]GES91970.1 hypothetical protein RCL_jg25813.t1 [Rhizophagus clarus]